jgi:dolichyl-phosphate beta-glucosyltransferase
MPLPPAAVGLALAAAAALAAMARLLAAWMARLDADAAAAAAGAPGLLADATRALSVVIPAYNEADRLPATLDETMAYLARRRDREGPYFTYEVIVVDDGSTDGTAAAAAAAAARAGGDALRVLRLPANRGKGAAVRAGLWAARGERLLLMDADGATAVAQVERLEAALPRLAAEAADARGAPVAAAPAAPVTTSAAAPRWGAIAAPVPRRRAAVAAGVAAPPPPRAAAPAFVLGSRAHLAEAAAARRAPLRNLLTRGFHALVTLVVGGAVRDTQCGFKLLTRAAARALLPNQRLQRWAFDVELVHAAQRLGVPMAE